MVEKTSESSTTAIMVVESFWWLTASNDFKSVEAVLADEFILEWPQSNERIRGSERFAAVNAEYPASGPWKFLVHRIVGNEAEAVSEVSVTDGEQNAVAVSFFTVAGGKITGIREYWPEQYSAPSNRQHLVEKILEYPESAA